MSTSIKSLPDCFELVGNWTRSGLQVKGLREPGQWSDLPRSEDATDEEWFELSYVETLLRRPDVDAVDLILPVPFMPRFVEAALAAGKHVISEKPILPHVGDMDKYPNIKQRLLNTSLAADAPVWSVSENWRFECSYEWLLKFMQVHLKLVDGQRWGYGMNMNMIEIRSFSHIPDSYPIIPDNVPWRQETGTGLVVEICVHFAAAIRKLLLAANETSNIRVNKWLSEDYLRPFDTFVASWGIEMLAVNSSNLTNESNLSVDSDDACSADVNDSCPPTEEREERIPKTIPVVWTNSFLVTENLRPEARRTSLSNLIVKLHFNNTQYIAVDRYDVEWSRAFPRELFEDEEERFENPRVGLLWKYTFAGGPEARRGGSSMRAFKQTYSVEDSLLDFARAVDGNASALINTPAEALQDLEFVEAILNG
eukprot:TRINITY_DN11779_c0_g1_i2.p1 TRINITY_DN11779_c0_g1~~TRINITY_DN11779_c0_g1_i2.p1  ORF type:complete len:424 (-),score=54.67 TRINITY_DN11779_c0_g1_i2:365-1636(-)